MDRVFAVVLIGCVSDFRVDDGTMEWEMLYGVENDDIIRVDIWKWINRKGFQFAYFGDIYRKRNKIGKWNEPFSFCEWLFFFYFFNCFMFLAWECDRKVLIWSCYFDLNSSI